MHLQAVVHDEPAFVSRVLFSHRAVHRVVGGLFCDETRAVSHHKSRRFQLSGHACKLELDVLVVANRLTKLLPGLYVLSCAFQTRSSSTEGAASNIKPAAIKTLQRNFEALALLAN